MALKSRLFAGDPKLEAAATSNPHHIVQGAVGDHVAKIQQALTAVDGAKIDATELAAKRYGPSTGNAVLSYKKVRDIVNRSYQTQADNIVGIMTMKALDQEMFERENAVSIIAEGIRCEIAHGRRRFPV